MAAALQGGGAGAWRQGGRRPAAGAKGSDARAGQVRSQVQAGALADGPGAVASSGDAAACRWLAVWLCRRGLRERGGVSCFWPLAPLWAWGLPWCRGGRLRNERARGGIGERIEGVGQKATRRPGVLFPGVLGDRPEAWSRESGGGAGT
eukprot:4705899-Prymnesium_polylepis.2